MGNNPIVRDEPRATSVVPLELATALLARAMPLLTAAWLGSLSVLDRSGPDGESIRGGTARARRARRARFVTDLAGE
ncbi:MAG TPA: hypothetical protein VME46_09230 [Acidimicrobiales bacterium]|nr:hypothetical protein [Acidimicrobiales bacterium]